MFAKTIRVRSESYRRWVASLPCIACGIEGFSQCAHSNHGKGLSLKTCDLQTFPLCAPHWGVPGCHVQHDMCMGMTRETRRALEDDYVRRTQAMAEQAGRKELVSA